MTHRQRHRAQADLGGAVRRDVGAGALSRARAIRSARWCSIARLSLSCRCWASMHGAASWPRSCAPNGRSANLAAASSVSSACSAISARWRGCRCGVQCDLLHLAAVLVALAALVLKERVRVYRWSAVIIGFIGVLVVLSPHLSGDELVFAATPRPLTGCVLALTGAFANAGTVIQTRRLAQERNDLVDRVLFLAVLRDRRPRHLAVRLDQRRAARISGPDRHRHARRHRAYCSHRKLSLRCPPRWSRRSIIRR